MQLSGNSEVSSIFRKWTFTDVDLASKNELMRIVGLQVFKITNTTSSEVSFFWLTGGTNFYAKGYEIPYQLAPSAPPPSGCTVSGIPPEPNSVFTNAFRFTSSQGVILIFRFSPTENFFPTVEIGPGSAAPFTIQISLLSIIPTAGQDLRSINGHYNRSVESFDHLLPATDINTQAPIPLKRAIGFQLWTLEVFNGLLWEEGGFFMMSYGYRDEGRGYPGLSSQNSVARIFGSDGLIITPLAVPQPSGREVPRTFRATLPSGKIFDLWYEPVVKSPTITLQSPLLPLGYVVRVRIQIIKFNP